MEPNKNKQKSKDSGKKITRKQAIKKVGITALTSASIVFLSTQASAKSSKPKKPGR